MEAVTDFIFVGSKITVDGDCRHEIKIYLLLGRKAMTNLDSILERRNMTLLTKAHIVKAMVFPVPQFVHAVRGILKSLFQHHNLKASVLQCSVFLMI